MKGEQSGGAKPKPAKGGYREQYGLILICRDEADQRRLYDWLRSSGFEPRVVVT